MTLREDIEKQLEKDYASVPKKYWNKKNQELIWDVNRKIYIGKNSLGQEIIAAHQTTRIPFYFVRCTNLQRKGNFEVKCEMAHCISICQDAVKCHKCNEDYSVEHNVLESSVFAFELWKNLDKEVSLSNLLKVEDERLKKIIEMEKERHAKRLKDNSS